VFTAESRGESTLFEGIKDGVRRAEELFQDDPHTAHQFSQEKLASSNIEGTRGFTGILEALVLR
jgi:hypothetical protein